MKLQHPVMPSNINIRPLTMSDAPRLAMLIDDHDVVKYLRNLPSPYSLSDAKEFINKCLDIEFKNLVYAITYQEEFCGVIGFYLGSDIYCRNAEIGYWLGKSFWGKGIMTEAVGQATQMAVEQLDVSRIFGGVFSNNKPSMKVLEKNGFHLESIAANKVYKLEKVLDEYIYVKLIN